MFKTQSFHSRYTVFKKYQLKDKFDGKIYFIPRENYFFKTEAHYKKSSFRHALIYNTQMHSVE